MLIHQGFHVRTMLRFSKKDSDSSEENLMNSKTPVSELTSKEHTQKTASERALSCYTRTLMFVILRSLWKRQWTLQPEFTAVKKNILDKAVKIQKSQIWNQDKFKKKVHGSYYLFQPKHRNEANQLSTLKDFAGAPLLIWVTSSKP